MRDSLRRGVGHDSAIRFLSIEASAAVATARERHNLDDAGTIIIAQAMLAALMMSAYIKGEERITLQLQCESPRLSVMCDVDAEGNIRARLSPILIRGDAAVLSGLMLVIKHSAREELYRGVTEIDSETVPQALARHLLRSNQSDTRLKFDVQLGDDGRIARAAGLLIERMPPAPGLPSLTLEEFSTAYGGLEAMDADALFADVHQDRLLGTDLLSAETRPVTWQCRCSQERVEGMLAALGVSELHSMLAEDNGAEITCHFCSLQYTISGPRLAEIIEELGLNA